MNAKLLFVPFKHMSANRVHEVVDRICALEEGTKIVPGEEIDVSVEAMLEAEAAWVAVEQMLRLKATDQQGDILRNEMGLLDLHSMGRQYWVPRDYVHHDLLGLSAADSLWMRRPR